MASVILIPDGSIDTQETVADGDLLILGSGQTLAVDGAPAVVLDDDATTLANDGAISAVGAPAVVATGSNTRVVNGGGDSEASITSDETAIVAAPTDGGAEITNLGTIDGAFNGVDFSGAPEASGKLFNAGLVTSASRPVNIVGENVQVVNSGTIRSTADPRNGVVYTDTVADNATIFNAAGGLIEVADGFAGDAVSLQLGEDVDLSFSNAGTAQGRGEPGGSGQASGLRLLTGAETISSFSGALLNKGLLASEATTGIGAGVLIEDGIIATGQLLNEGTITGPRNGLYLGDGDYNGFTVFNGENGVITSASRAVNIDGEGLTFVNAGLITHDGDARNGTVYSDVTADGYSITNTATGTVDAGEGNNGDAVSLQLGDEVSAEVVNEGALLARGEAALSGLASGIRLFTGAEDGFSVFTGTLTNAGTISSEATTGISAGILVEDSVSFIGEIINSGEIFGPFNGIYIGDNDHELTITNTGLISSDSRAVNIGGDGVVLINEGEILGTGDSRNGVVYSDDESNQFEIRNLAAGLVDAGAGNDGHAVSIELGEFSQGVVDNDGLLVGRGESAGIRLFSNPETAPAGSTFEGLILSEGTIETEDGPGILIEENVTVTSGSDDPAVVVLGDIDAAQALDATEMASGLGFAHALGDIGGALHFGDGDDEVSLGDEDLGGGGSVDGPIILGAGDDLLATGSAAIGGPIELGAGNDELDALAATSDLDVDGGDGNDIIQTGDGDDRIDAGDGDDLVFSGAGNDVVFGGAGNDAIDGGAGFDVLFGDEGDDILFGGAGFDVVTGGPGTDIFVVGPGSDIDIITDFGLTSDNLVDLSDFGTFASGEEAYQAGGDVGGNAVWDFGDGDVLTLAEVDYDALSGDIFIV